MPTRLQFYGLVKDKYSAPPTTRDGRNEDFVSLLLRCCYTHGDAVLAKMQSSRRYIVGAVREEYCQVPSIANVVSKRATVQAIIHS